jgi:hypothetical protein
MGVSAQLADARSRLRQIAPPGSWDAVMEEVEEIRQERGVTLLVALQLVFDKLTAGWVPSRRGCPPDPGACGGSRIRA